MIWRIEQLLKFVEIPFVYSLLVIPFSGGENLPYYVDANGVERLNQLIFPLIFILGIVGGALSIVDPFGKLCKGLLHLNRFRREIVNWFDKSPNKAGVDYFKPSFLIYIRKNFWVHGINTLPINTEINKIVGMLYFLTLVIFLWIALPEQSYVVFTESLSTSNFVNGVNGDTTDSVRKGFSVLFIMAIVTVFTISVLSLLAMRKKIRTASIFLYGVSHISNLWSNGEMLLMQDAMREGRWELAEEYSHAYYRIYMEKNFPDGEVDTDENKAKEQLSFKHLFSIKLLGKKLK